MIGLQVFLTIRKDYIKGMAILNKVRILDFKKLKLVSVFTYVFLFGSIRAIIMYKDMLYFWIVCTLIGGILLVIKNLSITNKKYKGIIIFCDILLLVIGDIVYFKVNIPFFIKDIFFIIAIAIYLSVYFKLLFTNKLLI